MMFNRSHFLGALGATGAAFLALGPHFAAAAGESDTLLVVVAQTGGCDFLNTIFSLDQYGKYHDLRRPAVPTDDPVLPLAVPLENLQATRFQNFAFHPKMTAFNELYARGAMAVVLGVGLPKAEHARLSHEAARFDWHAGSVGRLGIENTGWVARGMASQNAPGCFR